MTNLLTAISPNSKTLSISSSPKRPLQKKQNKLGPYNLLQTLGEGEFGKVKLGVHTETGQEVAIKLIKKEGSGSDSRINKVEREISVLKTLNHPYIVKLFNVVETEKYIGIILEYASGGELFEYILAHRYLKEKDAKRFFAQLISSVQYMHKCKIVHRDLKLENLLLDKNRNIIVTDFGFANQFSSAADDMMATTCGSPCYAAPELVVNAGLYAGSAVDIWSCGVILYAMLCGFLPFDDDASNPDGDNINQLYRYIVSTNLMFPSYVSIDARDLLEKMLVPDPTKRCSLDHIVKHPWLESYRDFLKKDRAQLEMETISKIPSMPTSTTPKLEKSYLILTNSVSTTVQSTKREAVPATRKTHIPVVARDRFAQVANDKYLSNKVKPSTTTDKSSRSVSPTSNGNNKTTNSFRHFSIGRSCATTTPIEKPAVHATVTPTTTARNSKVPNFITRRSLKKEEEVYIGADSRKSVDNSVAAIENTLLSADINPEKSLSSPLLTQDGSKSPTMSAFRNIRINQRRGTDTFLSFFTGGGSASHIPAATSNSASPRPFTLQKEEVVQHHNDGDIVISEVIDSRYYNDDDTAEVQQHSNITAIDDQPQEDQVEQQQQENKQELPRMMHSSSEESTIGGSTPSLPMPLPNDTSSDPYSSMSPIASTQQSATTSIKNPAAITNNLAVSSSALAANEWLVTVSYENRAAFPIIVGDSIQEDEEVSNLELANNASSISFRNDDETWSNISHQQQQQARDRSSSITTASILSDTAASVSVNSSVVSFKDAPRRTPLLFASSQKIRPSSFIMRQQQQHHQAYNHQYHRASMDNNSSSILPSTYQHHDNASVSSASTTPQLEVSNSTCLNTTKTVVSNAMGDGGRKAMAAVRRSIYRKHKSQPPLQPKNHGQILSDASSNASSSHDDNRVQKEPLISCAKSRFEENGTQIVQKRSQQQNNSQRNTWSATSLISSVSELPGKKKAIAAKPEGVLTNNKLTTTNDASAPPKRTRKKMMDFFKKKSSAKETNKDTSNAVAASSKPSASTVKATSPANTPLLTKPRKLSTKKEVSPAVAVAAIPKPTTTISTNKSSKRVTTTSSNTKTQNTKNVVSILQAPNTKSTKTILLSSSAPSPTPQSPTTRKNDTEALPFIVPPPHSNVKRTSALSGNAVFSASMNKKTDIDERIQIHQGAIDRTALTSQSPMEVIKDITRVLRILGIDAKPDGPYVLKCSRRKAKSFIAAELLMKKENEEEEGLVEEGEGQSIINDSAITTTSEDSLLAPSSNKDSHSLSSVSSTANIKVPGGNKNLEPIYGDVFIDNGDEIRFAVEICRFKNLPGLYIVDMRRLRGNAWAYKFLYHKLMDFLDLENNGGYVHN